MRIQKNIKTRHKDYSFLYRLDPKDQITREAFKFCLREIEKYETEEIELITIQGCKKKGDIYSGLCSYPNDGKRKYKITCQIEQEAEFPLERYENRKTIQAKSKKHAQKIAEDRKKYYSKKTAFFPSASYGKSRLRIQQMVKYHGPDELLVTIFGHEIFHYLRYSKQVKGANNEVNADLFGKRLRIKWKKYKKEFFAHL
jgi:hypothetical protein